MQYKIVLMILATSISLVGHPNAAKAGAAAGASTGSGTNGIYGQSSVCNSDDDFSNCLSQASWAILRSMKEATASSRAGNSPKARGQILGGVRRALQILKSWPYDGYPLTVEALNRAIEFDRAYVGYCGEDSDHDTCEHENHLAAVGLAVYLEFVTTQIIPLDRNYYIPSLRDRDEDDSRIRLDWWRGFVTNYRDVAVKLMRLYHGDEGGRMPGALGRNRYEINVATLIFKWVTRDLGRDDMGRFYQNSYELLREASQSLEDWSNGHFGFESGAQAVHFAQEHSGEILLSLNSESCAVNREEVREFRRYHRERRRYHEHRNHDDGDREEW